MHTVNTEKLGFEKRIGRVRLHFSILFSIAVLFLSFLYGIAAGIKKSPPLAEASLYSFSQSPAIDESELSRKFLLAAGISVFPIGEEATLNGRNVVMGAFVSNRPVKNLLTEQVEIWQKHGFIALGAATSKRGSAFALDSSTGVRYSISAWSSLSPFDGMLPEGFAVQGTVAVLEPSVVGEDSSGEIPGVPLRPGGTSGAVFGSIDRGVRTQSGVYSNPGPKEVNLAFYRESMLRSGWRLNARAGSILPWGDMLSFQKDGRKIVMIFAEKSVPTRNSGTEKSYTIVFVTSHGAGHGI